MQGSGIKLRGGGGGGRPGGKENSLDNGFFFLSATYFTAYRGGPMVLLQRKLYFSKDPEGVHHVPGGGGVQLFPGWGPNTNFYRNPYHL